MKQLMNVAYLIMGLILLSMLLNSCQQVHRKTIAESIQELSKTLDSAGYLHKGQPFSNTSVEDISDDDSLNGWRTYRSFVFSTEPDNIPHTKQIRAKSLEGCHGFISIIRITEEEYQLYKPYDTVWVNMDTHRIDDTCRTAMAFALLFNNRK